MNIPHQNTNQFYEPKEINETPNNENLLLFKNTQKCNTSAPESMMEQQERECQWRSNVLIDSSQVKERTPFALRHLTSFEEYSMDKCGKKLSQSFNTYICWLHKKDNIEDFATGNKISNVDWDSIEQKIKNQNSLNQTQKDLLISAAYSSTQAELLISQIIQQIPEQYHNAALSLAAFFIKDYSDSKMKGKQQHQILNYVQQSYRLESGKIYQRLCELNMANSSIRDHETYLKFVKTWMEVLFLSLNGVLEMPKSPMGDLREFSL